METVSNRMLGILSLYDLQTGFYPKALFGLSDSDAHKRLDTAANHVAWLAGSLVQQRFDLAHFLKVEKKSSIGEFFQKNQGIKDGVTYPSLDVYQKDWEVITPVLREALIKASDEQLNSILDFPEMKMSFPVWDMVTFSIYREANCIGQIALWRRLLGYPAMSYM
ncbi:DinB family protein [Chitinophaga sp. 22321]|uniref:DinB family protein n=1 Tax=Chitinophaga hostae TaxID=2831022 RepID=A0ABS5J379_9BACT|nr:DinB family protein [Chitinophaga hostae]MBS0028997.1 DinB family protein [Chitinophaga hostae]